MLAVACAVVLGTVPLATAPALAADDGTVLAWGADMTGQLGDGGPADGGGYFNMSTPVNVRWLGSTSGVVAVSAGAAHSLALRSDGSVLAWGDDSAGQLGDGPGTNAYGNQASPVWVSGLSAGSGVVDVDAGGTMSLALRADGSVLSWGDGRDVPTPVPGLGAGSGAVAISAGYPTNLVLRSDGSVVAWDAGRPGPVLYGPTGVAGTPVPVTGLEAGSGVVAISAGIEHSLALRSDGSVVAWGWDGWGQLGDDEARVDQAYPVPVHGLGPGSGVVAVSAGYHDSLALKADGSVLSWGDDYAGQLGDGGAAETRAIPGPVSGLGTGSGVVAVVAGIGHSLALRVDGSVLSWGWDAYGKLGDGGADANRTVPGPVAGLGAGSGVKAIDASYHNLVAKSSPRAMSTFAPVSPARVWDSRSGPGPVGRIGPGQTRTITVTGVGGVPAAGVTAVVLNVTAVNPSAATFVTTWPAGEAMPQASNLNIPAGDIRPNLVTVKVGASGQVSLFNAAGSVDLIADVAGWYGPIGGQRYTALRPARIWDSRGGVGPTGRVGPGGSRDILVTGVGGVPATGVSAVALNVTAVNPTSRTFVTAWPTGEPPPATSNLNLPAGDTRASLVIVKVGAGGRVTLANDAGTVDLIADVAGYFGASGANLTSVSPVRIWDTRSAGPGGRLGPGATRNVTVAGAGGAPPAGVTSVVLNVTAVNPSAATFVTVWPAGEAKPVASNLNIPPGDTRANLVIVKVGTGGQVSFSNAAGSVDLVADVAGWHQAVVPPPPPPLPPRIADAPAGSATTFQLNAAHDGFAPGTLNLPTPAVPRWTRTFGQDSEHPPQIQYALKVGSRVFVTVRRFPTRPSPYTLNYGVDLYALDAATGSTVWGPVPLGDQVRTAHITADSQAVYVAKDYMLSSYDQATGQERWSKELPLSWPKAPTVSSGLVYVSGGSYADTLFAVDSRTGLVKWEGKVSGTEPVAVADGAVYSSSRGNSAPTMRFDAQQGIKAWNGLGSSGFGSTVVVHDGSVYVADSSDSKRLAAADGSVLGTFNAYLPPAFSGDIGFFLSLPDPNGTWTLQAINQKTGAVLWASTGDGLFATPPVVADGKVILGSQTGRVTALDVATGAEVWSASAGYQIGTRYGLSTTYPVGLTVADGLLLVPSYDSIVAFGG